MITHRSWHWLIKNVPSSFCAGTLWHNWWKQECSPSSSLCFSAWIHTVERKTPEIIWNAIKTNWFLLNITAEMELFTYEREGGYFYQLLWGFSKHWETVSFCFRMVFKLLKADFPEGVRHEWDSFIPQSAWLILSLQAQAQNAWRLKTTTIY